MQFTHKEYNRLLSLLAENGYSTQMYTDATVEESCCILRHDVDYDLRRAVPFAEIENTQQVRSTYFVLLTTDFYNILSAESQSILHYLISMGHDIGLHFDEMSYSKIVGNTEEIIKAILREVEIMQQVLGISIRSVSMHRPSKNILEANLKIPGIVNSYSNEFFRDYKYVSDSRRRWREPVEEIIQKREFKRLHILTHPFWYSEEEETLSESLKHFIQRGAVDRYEILNRNFTDLSEAISI